MAKRSAAKVEEESATGRIDSGPVKVKWIKIVENPPGPMLPPPPPVQRVYFQGIEDGATMPLNGYFELADHVDWVTSLATCMDDDATFVVVKIDPTIPTITYQEHDLFLSAVFIDLGAGDTTVHGAVADIKVVVP